MKYFKIIILVILSLYSVKKGLGRFAARNDEAGIFFYLAAFTSGVTAIVLANQLYQEKKQENNKKED